MNKLINEILKNEKDNIVYLRRKLHKYPELSAREFKTAEFIESYLKENGYTPKRVNKTGVVAFLDAGGKESALLRADIDALPISEQNDTDYKSINEGVMHACGHDGHMAMLLSTAKILSEYKDKLSKNVLFVFQPAEEMDGGAEEIIKTGILDEYNVGLALGYHVMNDVPAGKVMIKSGALMACPDDFEITIKGKGGHGAMPEKSIDPIGVASAITVRLNAITNEIIKKNQKQVVQVCRFCAGTASNVIPQSAVLSGTARCFDEEVRTEIPHIIENIIKEETQKTGAEYEFKFNFQYPPLINDENVAENIKAIVKNAFGDIVTSWNEGQMTGDDFACFAKEVPALYMFLGTGNEKRCITQPLHSNKFEIDEEGLLTGVGIYLAVFLAENDFLLKNS